MKTREGCFLLSFEQSLYILGNHFLRCDGIWAFVDEHQAQLRFAYFEFSSVCSQAGEAVRNSNLGTVDDEVEEENKSPEAELHVSRLLRCPGKGEGVN